MGDNGTNLFSLICALCLRQTQSLHYYWTLAACLWAVFGEKIDINLENLILISNIDTPCTKCYCISAVVQLV